MPSSSASYLRFVLCATLGILASVIALDFLVDPFAIYHPNTSFGWIHSRPMMNYNLDLHKAHAVEWADADTLLLGSSRVALGIDSNYPGLPPKTYNLAIWGTAAYENWRYLQHAAAIHMPQEVILGIDREYFESGHPLPPTFTEERLKVNADGDPNPESSYADLGISLMSLSALGASLYTLCEQSAPYFVDVNGDTGAAYGGGLRHASAVLADNARLTGRIPATYRSESGTTPQLDAFKKTIDFCALHHIRLIVFVNPIHAALLDVDTANWAQYSGWLKVVVETMNSAPGLNWELWDFATYNQITTEPFPQPSDDYSHMKYYRECSHYYPTVGNLVLDRILNNHGLDGFGVRVTPTNVDDDLNRIARERAAWHNQIPASSDTGTTAH